jgi:hypothetical protein
VEAVAARNAFHDQVVAEHPVQQAPGGGQAGAVERGGSIGIDVGTGVQPKSAEQLPLVMSEVGIGQVERGGDRLGLGRQRRQPPGERFQLLGEVGR